MVVEWSLTEPKMLDSNIVLPSLGSGVNNGHVNSKIGESYQAYKTKQKIQLRFGVNK